MKIVDLGHEFLASSLDGGPPILITFVKRNAPPEKYPGNADHHSGTTSQELMRILISRAKYVNQQIPHWSNDNVIECMRSSILALENRAAERHGRTLKLTSDEVRTIENLPVCAKCGHIKPEDHLECRPSERDTSV